MILDTCFPNTLAPSSNLSRPPFPKNINFSFDKPTAYYRGNRRKKLGETHDKHD